MREVFGEFDQARQRQRASQPIWYALGHRAQQDVHKLHHDLLRHCNQEIGFQETLKNHSTGAAA